MVTSKKAKQYQKVTASVYDECPLPGESISTITQPDKYRFLSLSLSLSHSSGVVLETSTDPNSKAQKRQPRRLLHLHIIMSRLGISGVRVRDLLLFFFHSPSLGPAEWKKKSTHFHEP